MVKTFFSENSNRSVIRTNLKEFKFNTGLIKNFYKISEFYNFIKQPNNYPITLRNHVLVPFPHNDTLYFDNKKNELYRMSLAFQNISNLPDIGMVGSLQALFLNKTPIGQYSSINNVTIGSLSNEIVMNYLEMNDSILENFFYEWLYTVSNSRVFD